MPLFSFCASGGTTSVVVWGENSFGQTNVPSGLTNGIALACGDEHCAVLKSDGKITAWGYNGYGQANPPAFISNMVTVACGGDGTMSLRSNGTVFAWGYNYYGQ